MIERIYGGLIASAVTLVVVTTLGLSYLKGLDAGDRHATERMLEVRPKPLTHEQIRQAAWEAQNPCDGKIQYWEIRSKEFPSESACDALLASRKKKQAERERAALLNEMLDCVHETDPHYYEDETNHIDTVEHPRHHYSWVLGGDCEQMAHNVKNTFGLCATYKDDDKDSAEYCRQEVNAWHSRRS